MSTSNLYKLYKTKTRKIAEFQNGWGSAPALWSYLCVKFLNWQDSAWLINSGEKLRPLWNLVLNPNVPTCLRIAHAFTFDKSACPIIKIPDLIKACQETYTITHKDGYANHWGNIARTLTNTKVDELPLA